MRKYVDMLSLLLVTICAIIFLRNWATGVPADWGVWTFALVGCFLTACRIIDRLCGNNSEQV